METIPTWDSSDKVTEVSSLEPIAQLTNLRHLALLGVIPNDRSLSAIERCRGLMSARFSKYPEAEVARFHQATGVSDTHVPEPEFESG